MNIHTRDSVLANIATYLPGLKALNNLHRAAELQVRSAQDDPRLPDQERDAVDALITDLANQLAETLNALDESIENEDMARHAESYWANQLAQVQTNIDQRDAVELTPEQG